MHELRYAAAQRLTDCECLPRLMLTLSTDKVEHSVFMEADEETVSATFCSSVVAESRERCTMMSSD